MLATMSIVRGMRAATHGRRSDVAVRAVITAVPFDVGAMPLFTTLSASWRDYSYFSLKEVEKILSAATDIAQFGWVVSDYDVSDFLNRVAVPRLGELSDSEHRALVQKVIEERVQRAVENS